MSNSEAKKLLPKYTLGEELWNSISHGLGALFGIFVLVTTLIKAEGAREIAAIFLSMTAGLACAAGYVHTRSTRRNNDISVH